MLLMLRSLGYGQTVQSSFTSVTASLPFLQALDQQLTLYQAGRKHDGGVPVGSVGQLDLTHVTFSYVPGQPVLRNLSVSIPQREVVGIVGPSGGGESTLVQLLLGLRDPDSGEIRADGRSISDLSKAEWARKVTFVPQTANLIAGTIADNIRFMREGVTQSDVEHAAALAHLSNDVAGFADGYAAPGGHEGWAASGGQQQRVCIARALVEDPDVLILDEPTSSLDVQSEHLIRQTLVELKERMTIVIIAHRLSTLGPYVTASWSSRAASCGRSTPLNAWLRRTPSTAKPSCSPGSARQVVAHRLGSRLTAASNRTTNG